MDASQLIREALTCAKKALDNAYAPYSNFRVASAVIDEEGKIYTGVNVENASYGLTICAERSAISAAVANGSKRIIAIVIISEKQNPISPCGACRQVIAEFADVDIPVVSEDTYGKMTYITLGELLPMAFRGPIEPA